MQSYNEEIVVNTYKKYVQHVSVSVHEVKQPVIDE